MAGTLANPLWYRPTDGTNFIDFSDRTDGVSFLLDADCFLRCLIHLRLCLRIDALQGQRQRRLNEREPEISLHGLSQRGDNLPGCGADVRQTFRGNPADQLVGIVEGLAQDVEDQGTFAIDFPQGHGRLHANGRLLIPEAGVNQGRHGRLTGGT